MTRNSIVGAPSKFDLAIAFFDKEKSGRRRTVTFKILGPNCLTGEEEIEVVLNHITWEDGSGESWYFEGYCKSDFGQGIITPNVKGWFRTTNRKGWIDIDAPARSQITPVFTP